MSELTKQQEATLIRVLRKRWASALQRERALFRGELALLHSTYRFAEQEFIRRKEVVRETLYESIDLSALNTLVADITQSLTRTETAPEIKLDFDSESNAYDGIDYDSIKPFAAITYYRYTFLNLSACQRRIQSSIKNTVKDAQWKFAHQPNGKDVKRYLTIIANEEEATT